MWDLSTISEESQRTLTFLLLVPVGTLITATFQSVFGLRTIGIFSPTLLALGQTHSDWRFGAAVFAITFGMGSLGRYLLIHAKLSTITRRGIVVTFLVMIFAVMIVMNERFGLVPTTRSVLLPVTIITLMVDRFFTIIARESQRVGCIVLGNTILVTACCFIVFACTPVGRVFLLYPWLELVVIVGLAALGLYVKKPLLTNSSMTDE
jgi:hypothetical protein